ncbi:HET-domain-containing protein, partial [Lophium mytilinum]
YLQYCSVSTIPSYYDTDLRFKDGHDQFGFGRTPPQNSSANSTFQLASKWLHECLEKHDICSQSNGGVNPRPARLIDIGTDSDNQNIRVCDVHTLIPPYFTLSYCWGGKEFLKSDSKTLNRWKENIPWELVPKTFQDAVIITRRLGYRYLWIDSLCILQDSNDDWQIESSKMASIYEHGVLNIFAALAPNADYGCFHDHRAEVQEEPPLPLYQRGWAFQERYLSPRALYYRHFEVYWRCRVATHCECGSFSAGIDEEQHDKFRFLRLETDEIPHPEDTSADTGWANVIRLPFGPWEKVVQAYSRCQLSYISDKLPAVSGLAKRFRQQEFGAYFAGIWESQLPRGLLWHGDDQPNKRRPDLARGSDSYRAPSWSWASVNGAVD